MCLLHTPFLMSPLFPWLGSSGEGGDGVRARLFAAELCSCGSVSSEDGREGCARGQEGAGGAGAHTQAVGCTEVCPSSLRLQPERLKGRRVKTPLPPSQTRTVPGAAQRWGKTTKKPLKTEQKEKVQCEPLTEGSAPALQHPVLPKMPKISPRHCTLLPRGEMWARGCAKAQPQHPVPLEPADAAVPALLKQARPGFAWKSKINPKTSSVFHAGRSRETSQVAPSAKSC